MSCFFVAYKTVLPNLGFSHEFTENHDFYTLFHVGLGKYFFTFSPQS
jgi:hypothetical protein